VAHPRPGTITQVFPSRKLPIFREVAISLQLLLSLKTKESKWGPNKKVKGGEEMIESSGFQGLVVWGRDCKA
jgi:hypothetical protein